MMMTENVEQTPMFEPKKPKQIPKFVKVLIIIAAIIGVTFIGYNVFQIVKKEYVAEKKKKEEAAKQKELDSLELISPESSEVVNLFNTLTKGPSKPCGINIYFTDKEVTPKDINNSLAFEIIVNREYNKGKVFVPGEVAFTDSQLETAIKKYFGSDYDFTHKTYTTCQEFSHSSANNSYTAKNISTCNKTCGYSTFMTVTKAEKNDEVMYFYVRVIFYNKENKKFYSDYKYTHHLPDLIKDQTGRYDTVYSNYSQGGLYIMKFKKENNNFVFVSSKLKEDEDG